MLGKLIKHEFKAVNRLMLPLHLGLIILTVIGRIYVQFTDFGSPATPYLYFSNPWFTLLNAMLVVFYFVALSAVGIITAIYLDILRFRKNLFTDEGYLMHTLPVKASELLWSKLIVAFVWQFIDLVLLCLSLFGIFVTMDVLREIPSAVSVLIQSFPEAFGVSAAVGIPLYIILFILSAIGGLLFIYMCITVGHSFNTHKILASVGLYVAIKMVLNTLSSIITVMTGGFSLSTSAVVMTNTPTAFWLSYVFNMIISLATCVGSYLVADYFMKHRLNLE